MGAKVIMPFSPEFLLVTLHQFLEACKFYAGKALAAIKPDRIEPEFGVGLVPLHMHMSRFTVIAGVKMKALRSDDFDRGHGTAG